MMCWIKKCRWGVLMVFVGAWILITRAEISAQILQFSPAQGVWDATGNYPNNEFDATNNIDLVQDDKGKITGLGTGFASDSGIDVSLVYNFAGSIKGGSNDTRVLLTMRVSGSATDGVTTLPVSGNIMLSLDLDKRTNILLGSGRGKLCVQQQCTKVDGPVQFDLPQPMDGSWTLALDIQSPDNKKIVGTAAATLSNGRVVPFTINGQYTKASLTLATFQPKFTLKGEGGSMTFQPSSHSLSGFVLTKAKLLGQNIPTSP